LKLKLKQSLKHPKNRRKCILTILDANGSFETIATTEKTATIQWTDELAETYHGLVKKKLPYENFAENRSKKI
jgi:hypothetical protein